jgi:DNA-binding NtrC family response regulator
MRSESSDQVSRDVRGLALAGNRPIVVCVDDDRQILSALARTLRSETYETWTTEGSLNALEWLRTGRVGVLMADQSMPGLKGTELLRAAQELSPKTECILITAVPRDELIRKAMESFKFSLLEKPWDDEALRTMVRKHLHLGLPGMKVWHTSERFEIRGGRR